MASYSLTFSEPIWLWAIAPLVLFTAGLTAWGLRLRAVRLRRFIDSGLGGTKPSAQAMWLRFVWATATLSLLAIALARPLLGEYEQDTERLGVDLIIAIDTSRSMLVEDDGRTRLEAVASGLDDLLNRVSRDRVMLVAFAGEARIVSPMTYDHASLRLVLEHLDDNAIWRGGSSIHAAIDRVAERAAEGDLGSAAMILISDGEETEGDAVLAARRMRLECGPPIYTVGIGTPAPKPLVIRDPRSPDEAPRFTPVQDARRQPVSVRLDEPKLRAIASAGGGAYEAFDDDGLGLIRLFERQIEPIARSERIESLTNSHELFQFALVGAWVTLVLGTCVRRLPRWSSRGEPAPRRVAGNVRLAPAASAALVAIVLLASCTPARAEPAYDRARAHQRAEELIEAGQADRALALLQEALLTNPDDPYLLYNYGISAREAGQTRLAESAWSRLVTIAGEDEERLIARARFQIGNVEALRAQDDIKQRRFDDAVLRLENAKRSYELSARTSHENRHATRVNLGIAQDRLGAAYLSRADSLIPSEVHIQNNARNRGSLRHHLRRCEQSLADTEAAEAIDAPRARVEATRMQARERWNQIALSLARATATVARDQESDFRQIELKRQAIDDYSRFLEQNPGHPEASAERDAVRRDLAELLEARGDRFKERGDQDKALSQYAQAMEAYQEATDLTPDNRSLRAKADDLADTYTAEVERLASKHLDSAQARLDSDRSLAPMASQLQNVANLIDSARAFTRDSARLDALEERTDHLLGRAFEDRAAEGLAAAREMLGAAPGEADAAPPDGEGPGESRRGDGQGQEDSPPPGADLQDIATTQQAVAQLERSVADYDIAMNFSGDVQPLEAGRQEALAELSEARGTLALQLDARDLLEAAQPAESASSPAPRQSSTEVSNELRELTIDGRGGFDAAYNTRREPVDQDW